MVVPLLPVLLLFQGSQSGFYGPFQFVGPLTAFLLAWSISADVSYDSTAFALHVATGVRGVRRPARPGAGVPEPSRCRWC